MPSETNAAAPTATSTLVRRPALRCRHCRSAPISVASTKATTTPTERSSKWARLKLAMDDTRCPLDGSPRPFCRAREIWLDGNKPQGQYWFVGLELVSSDA